MKNKKIVIAFILLFILIGSSIYNLKASYGNTFQSRQRILSKHYNNAIILSEIVFKENIISEFIDQQSGYGYAHFEANEQGNYKLKTKMVRTEQYEPIVTDIIHIGDKAYEILMCNKSGLEYAEVIYTDNITGKTLEPIRVEMHNQTVAIIEAPDYTDYTRYVAFYNNQGGKFE